MSNLAVREKAREKARAGSKKAVVKNVAKKTAQQRILVVEDNDDTAQSLRLLLEALGYVTHVALDGEEAVAAAAKLSPDVILMDVGLPGISGYEAARRIRAAGASGRKVRIIALTGWGQQADRQRSAEAGIDHHLVKPLELDQLKQVLALAPPPAAG